MDINTLLINIDQIDEDTFKSQHEILFEDEIRSIIQEIGSCKNVDMADSLFLKLDQIQLALARLLFKRYFNLEDILVEFVYKFDRIDDSAYRKHIFEQIKSGQYC